MNYEITYTKREDYYIPNLTLPKSKYSDYKLAKYGRIRARYLKEHKKAEYTIFVNLCQLLMFNLLSIISVLCEISCGSI